MYVKWTIAPSGFCIGVANVNNKHYYSYGRNADHLEKNIKTRLYQKEHISQTQVHLEQQMSPEIDLQYAEKIFVSKYVKAKPNAQPAVVKNTIIQAPKPPVEYLCEQKDGEMIVYEVKEVARYKVHKIPAIKMPDINVIAKPNPFVMPVSYGNNETQGE